MERHLGQRVHAVPHRRIDEAIERLPAPPSSGDDRDLVDAAHAAAVLVIGVALAVAGAGLASLIESVVAAHLH